jgi:cytoskeletal protein RodZ
MRRLTMAITAVLLTTACASTATQAAKPPTSPSSSPTASAPSSPTSAPAATPSPTPAPSSATPTPSSSATGQLTVAIPAAQLPYKPAAGAPALDDVSIAKTSSDSCAIPADDSGNEAQLLDAEMDVNVLITTFEFSNPCSTPLTYDFDVTQAIGSETGPTGGPDTQARTPVIQPGKSISFKVNVDPNASLTPTQLQQLWVGVTHITKAPA